jgi:predicted MarR family transcription regulator
MCAYLKDSVAENFGKCGMNLYLTKLQDTSAHGLSMKLKSIRMRSRSKSVIEKQFRIEISDTRITEYSRMVANCLRNVL